MDLIVNADDLGMSREVNSAIFDLMDNQLVTSASLLANAPHLEEACKNLGRYPHCSFGVHLNITEFSPLISHESLGALLNAQGEFAGEPNRRVAMDPAMRRGIFNEFCAQIERLQSLGVKLSHIDSHHYILTVPSMIPILRKVQQRYRIHRVRLSRNIYGFHETLPISVRFKKAVYNFMVKRYVGARTTQGFSDFELFYERAQSARMTHGSFEVVVHPGNPYYAQDEINVLRGPWRQNLEFPIRLINDNELA